VCGFPIICIDIHQHSIKSLFQATPNTKELSLLGAVLTVPQCIRSTAHPDTLDLSRFSAAPGAHLSGDPFKSQGAFPA
jgi:hypothetical protein